MNFLRLFWASFVSVGGLVGVYVTLVSYGVQWAFWLVFVSAAAITAVILYASNGVELIQRIKNFPKLLERVGKLEVQLAEAEDREKGFIGDIAKAQQEGILEGQQQVLGTFLSSRSRIPKIVATVPFEGQVSFLCAQDEELPPAGARFVVESANSGVVRGVVQAAYAAEGGTAYLKCIEPSSPTFWELLADRIEHDDSLPPGIQLATYSYAFNKETHQDAWEAVQADSKVEK